MLLALYSIFIFNIIFLTQNITGTLFRTNVLFTIVWSFCAGGASLGVLGMSVPSLYIHSMVFITLIYTNIVFFMINNYFKKNYKLSVCRGRVLAEWRYNWSYLLLMFLILLFFLPLLQKSLAIIMSKNFAALRVYAYAATEELASRFQVTLSHMVIRPFLSASMICSISATTIKKKYLLSNLLITLNAISYMLVFGGREMLITFVLVCTFLYMVTYWRVFPCINIKNILIVIIIIWGLNFASSLRSDSRSLIENLAVYFFGPFIFLEKTLEAYSPMEITFYGNLTFGSLLNFVYLPIRILGGDYYGSNGIYNQMIVEGIDIGGGVVFNALTTMLAPFLYDFGYIFFIFGVGIFAVFISVVDCMYYLKKTRLWLCLYIYTMILVFTSVHSYSFMDISVVIVLVSLYYLTRNEREK